jgi:hypothetical protein
MFRLLPAAALCASLCTLPFAGAQAGEVYTGFGVPGAMLGYSQPLNAKFSLRGDVASLGQQTRNGAEEGISYNGTAKIQRAGLFADWFPGAGRLRLTGGLTANQMRLDLRAQGNGSPLDIGGTQYPTSTSDRMDVRVEFPKVTPYLGIGYGHKLGEPGFGFLFDLGAQIGRAKVTATTQGPNLSQVSQSDLDKELQEIREGAGKVRAFPQLSLGVSYQF